MNRRDLANSATPVKTNITLCVRVGGSHGPRLNAPRIPVTKKLETTSATPIAAKTTFAVRADMTLNDEVERRGASPASNESTLSQSSTTSRADRRCGPRSLEPFVRRRHDH